MAPPFDWSAFEAELCEELRRALRTVGREHRAERFYAVALYGVDRALDGLLSLPLLAAATERAGAPPDDHGFWGARYDPADWPLTEIPLRERHALRLERALTAEATGGSQSRWRRVEARYERVLVRVARRLRDEAPALLAVSDDFILFVHDEAGGADLARKTIPRARFERLFPRQVADERERRALAAEPTRERALHLVSRFGCHEGVTHEVAQRQLLAMGADAVSALTAALSDPKHGWTAAKVLGQIGLVTPEVVDALRAGAEDPWFARALGMLGDHEWLVARGAAVAAHGLCAPLLAITAGGPPRPLDYRPLERCLDDPDDRARALVDEILKPGVSFAPILRTDVDEALRGLESPHAVVRWHAASRLGDRGLGAAAGRAILPALARCLADEHPVVRRLAVLSIGGWRAAGEPHRPALERLRDDPDEVVRRVVAHVLSR